MPVGEGDHHGHPDECVAVELREPKVVEVEVEREGKVESNLTMQGHLVEKAQAHDYVAVHYRRLSKQAQ